MKNGFSLFLLMTISLSSFSQKKMLTMQDAMVNARTTLAPENLKQLQFIKGSHDYVFLKKINDRDVFVKGTFHSDSLTTYLTLQDLNNLLRKIPADTVTSMPAIQFSGNGFTATIKGQKISFPGNASPFVMISKDIMSAENIDESGSGWIAFVKNHNLFVSKDGKEYPVSTDGTPSIVYGTTVHQSEFGITKGTFWNHDGKRLAYYRMDQSMVPDYPIIDWTERPAKVDNLKYPMAGDSSHHVTLWVYDTEKHQSIRINTAGPDEQYLTNVCWSPDDAYIYIAVVNREQNHFWVNQYDAATGAFIKTLFEEEDPKYAEPLVPMLFVAGKANQFIWQSRRDGWNHLFLYNSDGSLVKQLTKGEWEVTDVKGFDEKGENLFFVSTAVSPVSKNLYVVNLKSGKIKAITGGNSVHNTALSSDGKYVIDNYSDPSNPRTIQLIDCKTGKAKLLLQAKNPLDNYTCGEMNIFILYIQESPDLYCRMFKPVGFDSTKKYPVIVYWYGGPHAQMILNGWNGGAGDYWFQYMAERGYLVFTIDTRGSANRGKAFEQAIFRRAGEKQMEDLMTGLDYLKTLPFTDTSRMGLFGWSYGGFMTTDFMLTHPGVFKAAVAGGPVTNWKFYEIMYTERYMDRPQENPEGYEATDLTKKIGNLKGKLLLIHGMQDNVVVMQHSVNLVRAAIDKGVQVDYMIYPGHEHNVLGKDRAHLYQKVTEYLMENLH